MRSFYRLLPAMIIVLFAACKKAAELENTYFPADYGYRWVYETRQVLNEAGLLTIESIDTLTIKVDTIEEVMGVKEITFDNLFVDVSNRMSVVGNDVAVYHKKREIWIPLIPDKDFVRTDPTIGKKNCEIKMNHDTLLFTSSRDILVASDEIITKRLKGVGAIEQSWGGSASLMGARIENRLLYFIKGEDTVWRSDSCP